MLPLVLLRTAVGVITPVVNRDVAVFSVLFFVVDGFALPRVVSSVAYSLN